MSDQRMIDAQAKHISSLRTDLVYMQKKCMAVQQELDSIKDCGMFYRTMQKAILDDPLLHGEWIRFCSFLRLAAPDLEEEFEKNKTKYIGEYYDLPFMY